MNEYRSMNQKEAENIVVQLRNKAYNSENRMPSIVQIHRMLNYYGVNHWFDESINIVEYRSKGKTYVNSRHKGASGYKLQIRDTNGVLRVDMDSSDSYYSWNASTYANELLDILESVM